jgi:hypothetical protein
MCSAHLLHMWSEILSKVPASFVYNLRFACTICYMTVIIILSQICYALVFLKVESLLRAIAVTVSYNWTLWWIKSANSMDIIILWKLDYNLDLHIWWVYKTCWKIFKFFFLRPKRVSQGKKKKWKWAKRVKNLGTNI